MKLEQGRYYVRRDGFIVGPARIGKLNVGRYGWSVGNHSYTEKGVYDLDNPEGPYNLVYPLADGVVSTVQADDVEVVYDDDDFDGCECPDCVRASDGMTILERIERIEWELGLD